jgi:RHS repeat-associated protein
LTYVLTRGPAGMTVDPATGQVTWTPTAASPAEAAVSLQVYDSAGTAATQSFTVAVQGVNLPPAFSGLPAQVNGLEGQPITLSVQATDPEDDPLTYWADNLPPGAVFDPATQSLNWTPSYGAAGTYPNATFTISDSLHQVSQAVTFVIAPNPQPPIVLPPAEVTAREGDPIRIQLQASDPRGAALRYSSDNLPPGATLDPNTGLFLWTPNFNQHGSYKIPFTVDNGQASTTQVANITVLNVNAPPVWLNLTSFQVQQNQRLQFRAMAFDPNNPGYVPPTPNADGTATPADGPPATLTYTASLPAGATFDPNTLLFTWTRGFDQVGPFQATFTATNDGDGTGVPLSTSQTFAITVLPVNRPPQITAIPNQTVKGDATLDLDVQAPDPDNDKRVLTAVGLPSFGSFTDNGDGTGTFHFAPGATDGGNYTITLQAADDGEGGQTPPLSARQSFVLTVQAPPPPHLDYIGDKVALIGQPLQFTLKAEDRDQLPLAFPLPAGLPAAASITPTTYGQAVFSWTPTAADAGTYPLVFQVLDNGNGDPTKVGSDQQAVRIVVRATDQAPVIVPISDPTVTAGQTLVVTPSASDPDGDPLTWAATALPPGTSLDPASGVLTWVTTLSQAGTYPGVTLTASDGSLSASQTFTIHATAANQAPVFLPAGPQSGREGAALRFTLGATDPDGDKLTFAALAPLPDGVQLNAQTGEVDWTPTFEQQGDYTFHLGATDTGGLSASVDVPVHIANVDRPPTLAPVPNQSVLLGQTLQFTLAGSDPDVGDTLTYSAAGLPDGATLDPKTGAFAWTPSVTQAGDYTVTFSVSDGELTEQQTADIRVLLTSQAPTVTLELTPSFPAVPGQQVIVHVSATGVASIAQLGLTADGQPLTLDSQGRLILTAGAPGRVQLQATATDVSGQVGHAAAVLKIRDPADTTAPIVALDPALAGARLAAATAVTGTVSDSNLDTWTLEIAPLDSTAFTTLATGTASGDNAPLTTLDPGAWRNGVYQLRLSATDMTGRTSQVETTLEVDTAVKPPQYLRTETDLTAQLGAATVSVTRVYDSLNRDESFNFGNGWSLAGQDADIQISVPPTGNETDGIYNPFVEGTRVYLTLPDGQRVGFTFTPQRHDAAGLTWYTPAYTADPGVGWRLDSAAAVLTRGGAGLYDAQTAEPYNPASGQFDGPQYTLTAPDGTVYDLSAAGGTQEVILPGGQRLYYSGSGITSSTGEAIRFIRDAAGRITTVERPDGTRVVYAYDAQGNLVSAHNTITGQSSRYGYAADDPHLLTLATAPAASSGAAVTYGPTAQVIPLTADLGATAQFLAGDYHGNLAAGGTDSFAFLLTAAEVHSTQTGTVLLGVQVRAEAGSSVRPAVPAIAGLTPVLQRIGAGSAFALFAVSCEGLELLQITGADANTTGAYTLSVFVAGDANQDGAVNGSDGALVASLIGTSAGQAGYVAAADANRDGVVDAADVQLVAANLGFQDTRPPLVTPGTVLTHVSLPVRFDLGPQAIDPQGYPVFFRVVSADDGTATLNPDGHTVTFVPAASFTGTAGFRFQADDGLAVSAPTTITVNVSSAPLVSLDFQTRQPRLPVGGSTQVVAVGDFTDQQNVVLDPSYLTLQSTDPAVATVSAAGRLGGVAAGTSVLVASAQGLQAATAVTVGVPQDPLGQELYQKGLALYPLSVSLSSAGGTRQLDVHPGDDLQLTTDLAPGTTGTQYFLSQPGVVTVSPDGLLTAVAPGRVTVTIIHGPAEAQTTVLVQAPQAGPATVDAGGAVVQGSDGSLVAVPPGDLTAGTSVSIAPLAATALPMAIPDGFAFADAFQLNVGPDQLNVPVQLKVPVPAGVAPGTTVWFFRSGDNLDAAGNPQPIWWEVEDGVVGSDGFAHTASPPYYGADQSGTYMVAYQGGTIASKLTAGMAFIQAQALTEFHQVGDNPLNEAGYNLYLQSLSGEPIGIAADRVSNTGEEVGTVLLVPLPLLAFPVPVLPQPQTVVLEQIPPVGPPVLQTLSVQVNPGQITRFTVNVTPPPAVAGPPAPQITSASVDFAADGTPEVVLTGQNFVLDNSAPELAQLTVTFQMPGGQKITAAPDGVDSDFQHLHVPIPDGIAVGLARITVSRPDPVRVFPTGPNGFLTQMVPTVSNAVQLDPNLGHYVFVALPEAPNGSGGQGEIGVLDGNPDSSTFNQVIADIPVGAEFPTAAPRQVAVSPDNSRVYATLRGGSSVAVIDALALRQVAEIPLPHGSVPYGIAVDAVHQLLYVTDQVVHKWTIGADGAIHGISSLYVIDINPASATYNQVVKTIQLQNADNSASLADSGGLIAPTGLRNVTVSPDGLHVYVAAPNYNRDPYGQNGDLLAGNLIQIDLKAGQAGKPPAVASVEAIPSSMATYGVAVSPDDPSRVAFTNAQTDDFGVEAVDTTAGLKRNIPLTLLDPAIAHPDVDPLKVHNAGGIAFITAADGTQYAFVAGRADIVPSVFGGGTDIFGNLIANGVGGFLDQTADPLHEDGNVGIIRDPFGGGQLVAATRPIAYGFPVDLMLTPPEGAAGDQYLYVSYQGLPLTSGSGGVMVYDATAMIAAVENPALAPYLSQVAIDDLPVTLDGVRNPNPQIDVQADYHIDYTNPTTLVYTITDQARAPIATGGFPGGIAMQTPVQNNTPPPKVTPKITGPAAITLSTAVNGVTGDVIDHPAKFAFNLNVPATVSLTIDGDPVEDVPDPAGSGNKVDFTNIPLGAGSYITLVSAIGLLSTPGTYDYELKGVTASGAVITATGTVNYVLTINSSLPVGHTSSGNSGAGGVDLFDGQLTLSAQDVAVPGRGLSLDFTRTYSSAGNAGAGPLGAGWTYTYNYQLYRDTDGNITVIDGTGNSHGFHPGAAPANSIQPLLNLPAWAKFYAPQAGYHDTLAEVDVTDAAGDITPTFYYVTPDGTLYVFDQETGDDPALTGYKLAYIQDPDGNRISLYYAATDPGASALPAALQADIGSDPTNPSVITDSSGRALVLHYQQIAGEARIVEVTGYDPTSAGHDLLGLDIHYHYDDGQGNLTSVVRSDTGGPAVDPTVHDVDSRSESYGYSTNDPLDPHNLTSYTDPNDHPTSYVYYPRGQFTFAPTGTPAGMGTDSHEFVKQIIAPGGLTGQSGYSVTGYSYDMTPAPDGNYKRVVTDPRPGVPATTYYLNAYGSMVEIDAPLGHVTHMVWATPQSPHPEAFADPSNPGTDVELVSQTDALGRTTSYQYDDFGNVVQQTISFSGITDGSIQAVTDRNGNPLPSNSVTTYFTYDPLFGTMTSKTDAERNTTFTLIDSPIPLAGDTHARGVAVPTLPAGVVPPAATGATGDLLASVDALGNTTTYVHARAANLPGGQYDGIYGPGDLESVTDPLGHVTTYAAYDRYGNVTRLLDAAGNLTTDQYDARSRLVERFAFGRDPTSGAQMAISQVEYAYDRLDRQVRQTTFDELDPANNKFQLPGDAAPWAEETKWGYLAGGQLGRTIDGLGGVTVNRYDGGNRLSSTTEMNVLQAVLGAPGAPVQLTTTTLPATTYAYDENSNLTGMTDGRGIDTQYTYDALNRRTKSEVVSGPGVPAGGAVTGVMTYDLAGNLRTSTDLHGNTTTYTYDGLYRAVATQLPVDDGTGNPAMTTTRYDLVGNKLRQTDANGNPTTYAYDADYRLTLQTDALGNTIQYAYDKGSDVVRQTHASAGVVTYVVTYDDGQAIADGLGRPGKMTQTVFLGDPTNPATAQVQYVTSYLYDDGHNRVVTTDPRGIQTETRKDGLGRVDSTTVDLGGLNLATTETYDADGNQATVTDPTGSVTTTLYDGLNRAIESTDALGGQQFFVYDADNNLVASQDRRGIVSATTYDYLNRLLTHQTREELTDGGAWVTLSADAYNDAANTRTETDANGNSTVTRYDGLGRVVLQTDPYGSAFRWVYDGVNLVEQTDWKGHVTRYRYDALNRRVQTDEYDSAGSPTPEATTVEQYDDARLRTVQVGPRSVGGAPVETITQSDSLGRVVSQSVSNPSLAGEYGSSVITLSRNQYDGDSELVLTTDADGNQTKFVYDAAGRRVQVIEGYGSPVEAATVYTYDKAGDVVSVKDARPHDGPSQPFPQDPNNPAPAVFDSYSTYDALHRKVTQTDGAGDTTYYGYDPEGDAIRMTDPKGDVTRYSYDEFGALLSVDQTGEGGGVTFYVYDADGNKVAQQDPDGNLVTYQYDKLNRLTDTFQFLTPGSLTATTTRAAVPAGAAAGAVHWHYGYDADNNRTLVIDPKGQETDLAYDYRDRLVSVTYTNFADPNLPFQPLDINYAYDANDNLTLVQEHKTGASGGVILEQNAYAYDALDRLTGTTRDDDLGAPDDVTSAIGYAYDPQGNLTSETVPGADQPLPGGPPAPSAATTTYDYDARNRLVTVHTGSGATNYTYLPNGLVASVEYPNNVVTENGYDAAGRLTSLVNRSTSGGLISSFAYTYDPDGNRTSQAETHQWPGGTLSATTTYGYDQLDRLTSATVNRQTESFTYDANGNRLTESGTDPATGQPVDVVFAYDRLNELVAATNNVDLTQSAAFTYDANGNRTQKTVGTLQTVLDPALGKYTVPAGADGNPVVTVLTATASTPFAYNVYDQLVRTTGAGGSAETFDYDAAGMRVKVIGATGETRYLYDAGGNLALEYAGGTGQTLIKYNYGLGLVSKVGAGGAEQFYLSDLLGSVSELTDLAGTVTQGFQYAPWGDVIQTFGPGSNNPVGFTGQVADPGTGLDYFGARYYDPATAGFMSQDSYSGEGDLPISLDRYAYAYDNPLRYTDPTGHDGTPPGTNENSSDGNFDSNGNLVYPYPGGYMVYSNGEATRVLTTSAFESVYIPAPNPPAPPTLPPEPQTAGYGLSNVGPAYALREPPADTGAGGDTGGAAAPPQPPTASSTGNESSDAADLALGTLAAVGTYLDVINPFTAPFKLLGGVVSGFAENASRIGGFVSDLRRSGVGFSNAWEKRDQVLFAYMKAIGLSKHLDKWIVRTGHGASTFDAANLALADATGADQIGMAVAGEDLEGNKIAMIDRPQMAMSGFLRTFGTVSMAVGAAKGSLSGGGGGPPESPPAVRWGEKLGGGGDFDVFRSSEPGKVWRVLKPERFANGTQFLAESASKSTPQGRTVTLEGGEDIVGAARRGHQLYDQLRQFNSPSWPQFYGDMQLTTPNGDLTHGFLMEEKMGYREFEGGFSAQGEVAKGLLKDLGINYPDFQFGRTAAHKFAVVDPPYLPSPAAGTADVLAEASAKLQGAPKLIGTSFGTGGEAVTTSAPQVSAAVEQSIDLWSTWLGTSLLRPSVVMEDLPAGQLGEARIDAVGPDGLPTAGTIVLSPDAAGVGWFAGSTPLFNSAFGTQLGPDAFQATGSSPAADEYDLLTVLLHEEGHLLGFNSQVPGFAAHVGTVAGSQMFIGPNFSAQLTPAPDDDHLDSNAYHNDLMNATLSPGVRRLPSPLDVQILDVVRSDASAVAADVAANSALDPVGAVFALWGASTTSIHNGDFSVTDPADPNYGWSVKGSVAVAANAATLTENPNVFSGLTQTFTVPTGATALRFTVTGNFSPNGLGPPDAFEAALLDPATGKSLVGAATGLTQTDAFFNLQTSGKAFFGPVTTVVGVASSGQTTRAGAPLIVTVSLQGLTAGTQAALHLDLLGFGPAGSSVRVANVQLLGPDGNHAPVANPDSYSTLPGQSLQVGATAGVLANDTDAENDPLTAQLVSQPAHGIVTLNADGSFLYTPAAGFRGLDSFTYQASDGQAPSQAATVSIVVNTPPVVTSSNLFLSSPAVDEGSAVSLTGAFTDPDAQAHTVTIDWGDGFTLTTLSLPIGVTAIPATAHTYRDEPASGSAEHITVTVSDGFASASAGVDVTVTNVTPVVAPMAAVTINQGDTLLSSGSFLDPATDTWTATVDYGDGSGVQPLALNADQTFALDHTYTQAGVFTATVTVRDDEGVAGTTTQTVTVKITHPVVQAGPDAGLNEGDTLTRSGQFFGAPGDIFTATVDYGDGSGPQPLALNGDQTFTLSHTYRDEGTYPVTVTVTDQTTAVAGSTGFRVTAGDVSPAVSLGLPVSLHEGDTLTSAGRFSDPSGDSWTAIVDYGDGSGSQPLSLNADHSFALGHTYTAAGSYTMTVTVRDDDGTVGTSTLAVTVLDVLPVLSLSGGAIPPGGDVALNEGDTLTSGGSFTDPGPGPWTATVDYGDGSGPQPLSLTGQTFTLRHTYPVHDFYPVTVQVKAADGGAGSIQFHAVVANVPPTLSLADQITLHEGDTLTAGGNFFDPGAETWTATVDYGDGSGSQPLSLTGKTFALSHIYPQDGDYTVTVTVDDGSARGFNQMKVHVLEVDPVVSLPSGPLVLNEGDRLVTGGQFLDPGADTWTATVDYGTGAQPLDLLPDHSFRLDHFYPRFGTFSVTVRVADQDGHSGSATLSVQVNDVPPLVRAGGDQSIFEGQTLATTVSFQDPGLETWTATVDYGDGSGEQAVPLAPGSKHFALAHEFATPGVFVVTVVVTDDGGASGHDSLRLTVVNLPPAVRAALDPVAGTSSMFVAHGLAFDAGRKPVTVTVVFGDGTLPQQLVPGPDNTFTFTHSYAHTGTFQVTVAAEDQEGAVTQTVFTVVINPPTVAGAEMEGFFGLLEEHLSVAGPELPPSPRVNTTDLVFTSFREEAEVAPIGNTLAGGARSAEFSDGGDKLTPSGQREEHDLFWPWMDRRVPPHPGKRRPASPGGNGKVAPDGVWGRRPILQPGAEAVEPVLAQRAGPETSSSGPDITSETSAEQEGVPAVEGPTAAEHSPDPEGSLLAERGWWSAVAGCLLAVAGLLGLCRPRQRRQ